MLNWFEKVPYLLRLKLGRSLNSTKKYETDETWMNYQPSLLPMDLCQVRAKRQKGKKAKRQKGKKAKRQKEIHTKGKKVLLLSTVFSFFFLISFLLVSYS